MMQMQKIKRLCLDSGCFAIVNADGRQWLGDGAALFEVPGALKISAGMLPALYELTDKQVEGCNWKTMDAETLARGGVELEDNVEGDVLLYEVPASVTIAGEALKMLHSADGEISLMVKQSELAPAEKYTQALYYARRAGSGWAVAIKNGYALVAYIMPYRIGEGAVSDAVIRMRDMLGRMIESEKLRGTVRVDPETGEVRE